MLKSLKSYLLFTLLAFSFNSLGLEVAPEAFFKRVQGDYQIISSGVKAPKGGTELGYVAIEDNEGLIVLPYCHVEGGVCDPGFRAFPLDRTKITEEKLDSGIYRYTLETGQGSELQSFVWEVRGELVHFFDPNYTLVSGETFPLEFVIERIH